MAAVHQRNAVFKTKHYSFLIRDTKLVSYWVYCSLKSYGKNLYHFFDISSNLFIAFFFLKKRAGKGYQVSFRHFFILFHPFSSKKAEKGRKRQKKAGKGYQVSFLTYPKEKEGIPLTSKKA